jgi:HAD superfamily hydrolase (TIGR01509 family)
MVDVVLFELEGVVFDTREAREASMRDARAALGVADDSEIDDVLADLLALRAARAFSTHIATRGLNLQSGARALIDDATATARVGVVTRAGRTEAEAMIRLAGLENAFTVTVCADDALAGKPSAAGYNLALDRLGRQRPVTQGAVLALEDCAPGIHAARAAGARCIVVGSVPAHVAIEADAYVDSLEGHTIASLDRLSRPGVEVPRRYPRRRRAQ